ncbi:MAG: glycosyltransferase [Clostridia bacterium]|nr:glycosyltransferase [Clostridia bacterium]
MEKKLKISVVTVVFNGEKTLEKTIQSVINQTYENIEYLIIDGGSSDSTVDIIKKYESKISFWKSEADKGIYDAMNKGLVQATGDFIIFLGADDLFVDREVVQNFVKKICCDSYDYIYYGNVIKTSNYAIYDGFFSKEKIAIRNICHQPLKRL